MRLTPEQLAARKRRNLALAGALVAFIVLVFATTVLKLQGNRDEAAALVEGQTTGQGG
ncbi:hypothetical protein [Brevundimonas sp.]|uniref:hypothetical protein n=1 Tax=Brevundimonas sp. TaxID=1871086 RepID=UPI002D2F064A|nr:hypothetical protein [Brevundimonas sp.]HYD27550.1 hypothetical protein [Brevundimonas sp.]